MPIAARAPSVIERDADRRILIAPLKCQVKINDGAATIAGNHKPMMFGNQRRAYRRPKPNSLFLCKATIEVFDHCRRFGCGFKFTIKPHHVFADFLASRTAVSLWHGSPFMSQPSIRNSAQHCLHAIIAVVHCLTGSGNVAGYLTRWWFLSSGVQWNSDIAQHLR
jgi:hypothetical protein